MTPAINAAKKAKIPYKIHKYDHEASAESYGLEAADKLGIPAERVFKTLVIDYGDKRLAVGIVPVSSMLDMKKIAKAVGSKNAVMAQAADVQRSTGYVLGGVSPLGQKKRLITVIDSSAEGFDTIFVSGGKRGLDIELSPDDLQKLTRAQFSSIAK